MASLPVTNPSDAASFMGTRETLDNSNFTAVSKPFDDDTATVVAVVMITLLVVGFFGNLLTILVIVTSKKLGLCVSDLLSASISWINLYRRTWGFNLFAIPNFFCVIYWAGDMWTSYVTAQHIFSFAILRLISVWKPFIFNRIRPFHAKIWVGTIWAVAFVCGFIPFAVFSGAMIPERTDRSSATWKWPACTQYKDWLEVYTNYTFAVYPVFFYIPLIGVLVVSIVIGVVMTRKARATERPVNEIKRRGSKRKKKEKQAILQLGLIVGSFILGYVPFTIFEFWTINADVQTLQEWKMDWMFGVVEYICLRVSECLNPLFYNIASSKMREETCRFFRKIKLRSYYVGERRKSETLSSSSTNVGIEL